MPGDVLLYRGKGLISDAIRFIDRSEVSHAGLFLGRYGEQGRTVGEAIREGVIRRELPKSIEHADWVESRRLKEAPSSIDPVLERAAYYLESGERYAFEQILLLAFLCITRNLAGSSVLGRLIRETLDAAAAFLLHLFNTGREPMICSEFVVRCYREALPGSVDLPVRAPGALRFGERGVPIGKNGGIHRGSALALLLERHGRRASRGERRSGGAVARRETARSLRRGRSDRGLFRGPAEDRRRRRPGSTSRRRICCRPLSDLRQDSYRARRRPEKTAHAPGRGAGRSI